MNQFDRQERQKQEEQQKKTMQFLTDCSDKLLKWQLENNCIVLPFISGPWMRGVFQISPELTFRPMSEEEKKIMTEQVATNAGIVLPNGKE